MQENGVNDGMPFYDDYEARDYIQRLLWTKRKIWLPKWLITKILDAELFYMKELGIIDWNPNKI